MKYNYEILKEKNPLRIRELPSDGTGYIHYMDDLKVKEFFEGVTGIAGQKTKDSFQRTRKWVEENYPEYLL
jgi:hypothetical protein